LLLRIGRLPAWRWHEIVDRRMRDLLTLNRDILVRTLCLVSTFAVFTDFGSLLGTTVLAANAILLRILNLASYLIDGAAFATESLAGIFRGRGTRLPCGDSWAFPSPSGSPVRRSSPQRPRASPGGCRAC